MPSSSTHTYTYTHSQRDRWGAWKRDSSKSIQRKSKALERKSIIQSLDYSIFWQHWNAALAVAENLFTRHRDVPTSGSKCSSFTLIYMHMYMCRLFVFWCVRVLTFTLRLSSRSWTNAWAPNFHLCTQRRQRWNKRSIKQEETGRAEALSAQNRSQKLDRPTKRREEKRRASNCSALARRQVALQHLLWQLLCITFTTVIYVHKCIYVHMYICKSCLYFLLLKYVCECVRVCVRVFIELQTAAPLEIGQGHDPQPRVLQLGARVGGICATKQCITRPRKCHRFLGPIA